MKTPRPSMFQGAGRAVLALMAILALGCAGGSGTGSKESASSPPPQAANQPRESLPSASPAPSLPLVDSRGHLVPATAGSAPSAGGSGSGLTWSVPKGWIEEPPASSMRKAQYALAAAPGDAEPGQCAVFYFGAGQGGDIKGNVDRWASQFTDAAGGHPTPAVTEGTVGGMKVMKVTTAGTYTPSPMMGGDLTPKPDTMLLGAIVEGADANWFFKCTGPKRTIESHRKEFDALIDSVRAP